MISLRMSRLFGKLLRRHLKARGVSQKRFAKLVGRHLNTINRIVAGKKAPPLKLIEGWGLILKLDLDQLLEFVEAAHLAHSTEWIEERYTMMREELPWEFLSPLED